MSDLDNKINAILTKKPWLKVLLSVLTALLGAGKARGYFVRHYEL